MSLTRFGRNFFPAFRRGGFFSDFDREITNMMRPLQSLMNDPFFAQTAADFKGPSFVVPSVDVKETDKAYELTAEMPGLKRENVDIELDEQNRTVTLKGESKEEKEDKNEKYYYRERSHGKFMRSFQVPEDAKLDGIKAVMRDGLLKLEIPKGEEVKQKYQPKKIDIISDENPELSK
jgi:HSP20 family protein